MITKYFEFARLIAEEHAKNLQADPLLARRLDKSVETALDYSEKLFSTTKRRQMAYDHVPVGHDIGYRCYDAGKHDAASAFESGEYGDGLSENEAYADWLRNVDETEPRPRMGRLVHDGGGEQPNEYKADRYVDPDEPQ